MRARSPDLESGRTTPTGSKVSFLCTVGLWLVCSILAVPRAMTNQVHHSHLSNVLIPNGNILEFSFFNLFRAFKLNFQCSLFQFQSLDEHSHMTFVLNNLNELLELLVEPGI